jgi:rod shape-determining protein MreC
MYAVNAEWSGKTIGFYNKVDEYLNLAHINKNLAQENANLKSNNKSSYFSLVARRDTIIDSLFELQYTFIEARVINSSFNKRNNYITLNRGSLHGVKPDMAVTSANGAIGIVQDVSAHYATVIPLIHSRSLMGAGFRKSNYFGSMSWDGKDYRYSQITDVPREAQFEIGDSVFSDTRSVSFPGNLLLGTVQSFELDPEDQTWNIQVKLSVDFAGLGYVYIIDNLFKLEQQTLEAKLQE